MARRWFVRTSDELITGMSDIDTVEVPADHTAVTDATIRAADPPGADGRIQGGGKWDGAAYTPPSGSGIFEPFVPDASTELGRVQIAFTALHQQLRKWEFGLLAAAHEKPRPDVQYALQFLSMKHWSAYVVSVMWQADDLTTEQVEAWATRGAQGALDIVDVQTYFEKAHLIDETTAPAEACTWVEPASGDAVGLETARTMSTGGVDPAVDGSYFFGYTVDLTAINLGDGAWIRELTA